MALARLSYCAPLLLAALLVGCRSGVERDVVQRELRQQEDQIYALEDYLSEYQQLLCDARAENATLKRQIVKGQFRQSTPALVDEADTLPTPPATAPSPPSESDQPTPELAPTPDVPALDLGTPAVPPLDASSEIELEEYAGTDVEPASAEIEVVAAPPTALVLRGEVQIDSAETESENSGPRVLLNVKPVDADGQQVPIQGKLSVLVLDPAALEKERQLARWDFHSAELAEMTSDAASGNYELPLQLPAESPHNRPLELWVRLLPEDGEKLLARTTMDLSRAGRFATADVTPAKKPKQQPRHLAHVASAEIPVDVKPRVTILDTNVDQGGWQIAKAGDVAVPTRASRPASSEWKLATRPIPETEPVQLVESSAVPARVRDASNADRYRVADMPAWTPNRAAGETTKSPPLDHIVPPPGPGWAPERFTR